ncbi:MAG: ABC transporter ATP-binding protein [Alphaproteobacteria bacterium]|nr:ABC transporter ATP-binding protein [Alphaproteobacteria bacterium]MDE6571182.1 ABC transporter ATP-binding protein [Alphaproteobacteria bacterium]
MNDIEIRISNVSKGFKNTPALNGVSMNFHSGNLYGVIGPAGAGKTTLFRLMLRLLGTDGGDVTYFNDGRAVDFDDFRQHIAYMPQSQSLYADLSVEEHLDFFQKLYSIAPDEYRRKKAELVNLARLDKFLDMPAGNLSGGMYKKLGLMCALLRSPKVMLLDEPTNGVDPISRREFWNLLHAALQQGILVIMSTAYMDEAERCSQVVLMENGNVLGVGEPRDLLKKNRCANFDEFFLKRGGVQHA